MINATDTMHRDCPAVKPAVRKSGTYPMLVTRISANHCTCTSSSLAFTAYDVTRDAPGRPWHCDCEARIQRCRHVAEVERYDAYRAEPVTPPTAAQVAHAATPLRSGSVMQVLARRRELVQAIRDDLALPFPAPQPLCSDCGTRPADPRYTQPNLCGLCSLRAAF